MFHVNRRSILRLSHLQFMCVRVCPAGGVVDEEEQRRGDGGGEGRESV